MTTPAKILNTWQATNFTYVGFLCFGMSCQQVKKLGLWSTPESASMRREWSKYALQFKQEQILKFWCHLFFQDEWREFALSKRRYVYSVVGKDRVFAALQKYSDLTGHEIMEALG